MSFFAQLQPQRNVIGESFLGGFNKGFENQSNLLQQDEATSRSYELNNKLYQQDYQASLPALEQILNDPDMSLSQKAAQVELNPGIGLQVKQRVGSMINSQIAANQKMLGKINYSKIQAETNASIDKAYGIDLANPKDWTEEQQDEVDWVKDRAFKAQLSYPTLSMALAINQARKEWNKNKKAFMAEQQEKAEAERAAQIAMAKDYEQSELDKKIRDIVENPLLKTIEKIQRLEGEGLERQEAVQATRKEISPEEAAKPVKEKAKQKAEQKSNLEKSRTIERQIAAADDTEVPPAAKRLANKASRENRLLSKEIIDKMEELGTDKEIIRLMRGEKRKATSKDIQKASVSNSEAAFMRYLEEFGLEE